MAQSPGLHKLWTSSSKSLLPNAYQLTLYLKHFLLNEIFVVLLFDLIEISSRKPLGISAALPDLPSEIYRR